MFLKIVFILQRYLHHLPMSYLTSTRWCRVFNNFYHSIVCTLIERVLYTSTIAKLNVLISCLLYFFLLKLSIWFCVISDLRDIDIMISKRLKSEMLTVRRKKRKMFHIDKLKKKIIHTTRSHSYVQFIYVFIYCLLGFYL